MEVDVDDYPKVDRSNFILNQDKTLGNDTLDIGWSEGTLSDDRPL